MSDQQPKYFLLMFDHNRAELGQFIWDPRAHAGSGSPHLLVVEDGEQSIDIGGTERCDADTASVVDPYWDRGDPGVPAA